MVFWMKVGFRMKVVLDEKFGMKSDSFIPIWMKVHLTVRKQVFWGRRGFLVECARLDGRRLELADGLTLW